MKELPVKTAEKSCKTVWLAAKMEGENH